jgi:hypothetical protein
MTISHDSFERRARLVEIRDRTIKPAQACAAVAHHCG